MPKNSNRFLSSIGQVSTATFVSRLLGFTRDIVCAQVFGAYIGFDAFLVAFKIPNFMRQLFAEGAFSQAFVPILAQHMEHNTPASTSAFINQIVGVLLCALGGILLIIYLFAPQIVMLFAPGFSSEVSVLQMCIQMLRVTVWYLPLVSLSALLAGILNVHERFTLPAYVPTLLSGALIIAGWVISHHSEYSVIQLALAVPIAGIMQVIVLLIGVAIIRPMPRPAFTQWHSDVRRVFKVIFGSLFGVAVTQISLLVDTFFASFCVAGSISWLYYSERLAYFPVGVVAVAISTVTLPRLSRAIANKDEVGCRNTYHWAINLLIFIALPASIGLAMLSGPLLVSLLQYGRFSVEDVLMAQKSLQLLALGVPAFMLIKVLVLGFYTRQQVAVPAKCAGVSLIINVLCCIGLVTPLQHVGIALSVVISSWCNVVLLLGVSLHRRYIVMDRLWWLKLKVVAASSVVMLAYLVWWVPDAMTWVAWSGPLRILHLLVTVVLAVCVYLFSAYVFSRRQLQEIYLTIA